jgi:hypothetical protein
MASTRTLDQYTGTVSHANDKGIRIRDERDQLSQWLNYSQWADVPHPQVGDVIDVRCDAGKPFIRELTIYGLEEPEQLEEWPTGPGSVSATDPEGAAEHAAALAVEAAQEIVSAPLNSEAAPLLAAPTRSAAQPALIPPPLRPMDEAVIRMSALKSATVLVAGRAAQGEEGLGAMDVIGTAALYEQFLRGQATFEELKELILSRASQQAARGTRRAAP